MDSRDQLTKLPGDFKDTLFPSGNQAAQTWDYPQHSYYDDYGIAWMPSFCLPSGHSNDRCHVTPWMNLDLQFFYLPRITLASISESIGLGPFRSATSTDWERGVSVIW